MANWIEGVITDSYEPLASPKRWFLGLLLKPWRVFGGEWTHKSLYVELAITKAKAEQIKAEWEEGEGLRVAAGPIRPKRYPQLGNAFMAKGFLPLEKAQLKAPPRPKLPARVKSPLGELKLDRGAGWYGAWLGKKGAQYEVGISIEDPSTAPEIAAAVKHGSALIRVVERGLAALRRTAAKKMLPLYNRRWREDRPRISAAALAARLELNSIIVDTDGGASVILGAGDLFGDHGVEVSLSPRRRVTRTALA